MRKLLYVLLALTIVSSSAVAQDVIVKSDTSKILLSMDLLKLSIQQGNRDMFAKILGDQLRVGDTAYQQSSYTVIVDSVFGAASGRSTVTTPPAEISFEGFWDFGLSNIEAVFQADTCFVTCNMRLYAENTESGQSRTRSETLIFVKYGKGWKLEEVNELFTFLVGGEK